MTSMGVAAAAARPERRRRRREFEGSPQGGGRNSVSVVFNNATMNPAFDTTVRLHKKASTQNQRRVPLHQKTPPGSEFSSYRPYYR